MAQTQKIYLGTHPVEKRYLGDKPILMSGAFKNWPTDIVRDGLVAYFNSTESGSVTDWKASVGDYTGSYATADVSYNATEQVIDFEGSTPSLQFGLPAIQGNPAPEHTVLVFVNPKAVRTRQVIEFQGRVGGGAKATYIELAQSGSDNVFSYLNSDVYRYTAYEFGAISTNDWHLLGYSLSGSVQNDIDLYFDTQVTSVTGSAGTVVIENNNWEMGVVGATGAFSGSAAALFVYDRKLSNTEVIQNYEYMYRQLTS